MVLASLSLVLLALGLAWALGLRIERELIVATVRAAVQLLAVGFVFVLIFESTGANYWAWLWVAAMIVVATTVIVRRAKYRIEHLTVVAGIAVLGSALLSIIVAFGFGVIGYAPVSLVVIAGITIGNAVPSAVLGVNRSVDSCRDRVGDLEVIGALEEIWRSKDGVMLAPTTTEPLWSTPTTFSPSVSCSPPIPGTSTTTPAPAIPSGKSGISPSTIA